MNRPSECANRFEHSEGTSSPLASDVDDKQQFNNKWGYLPPLDEEAVAVIEEIMADPTKAKQALRKSAGHPGFTQGLRYRNVFWDPSTTIDPCADDVSKIQNSTPEPDEVKKSYEDLWTMDRARCDKGATNEALFQRTTMMSLVARHLWINNGNAINPSVLDFSVEEPWSCPPMPTRAYRRGETFLTQPKPDLAVFFHRRDVIPEDLWLDLPRATMQLACFENLDDIGETRAFHFFTIEAKKGMHSINDRDAKRQSLNNASQALHNMFEFFRDAGSKHENIFFAKVRFFSVVATNEGVLIRIHRAIRECAEEFDPGLIMPDRPDYPLRFEHRIFGRIEMASFDRGAVLEKLEKILIGYGVNQLFSLLQNAAEAIVEKLRNDPEGMIARGNENFYRYGQTDLNPITRNPTPARSRSFSLQNLMLDKPQIRASMDPPTRAASETNRSANMLRSGTMTPTQAIQATHGQPPTAPQQLNKKRKPRRKRSNDSVPARSTRQRTEC